MSTLKKKKVCSRCPNKGEQAIGQFYNTENELVFTDKKIPICKTCCFEIIDKEGFEGFQKIMKLIDKPIFDNLFKGDHGDYIRQINSMPQYRGLKYESSNLFEEKKVISTKIKPTELTEEELKDAEDYFGEGLTEKDYIFLNKEYEDYLSRYEVDSKTLEDLIKEICLTQLDIRNKRADKKEVKNEIKMYQELLGSANLKPVQESGSNSVEQETFGTLVKRWENERPVPDPQDEWVEQDRIGKYLRVWFTGHLSRMFGLENKDEKEYYDELSKYTVELDESKDKDGDSNS